MKTVLQAIYVLLPLFLLSSCNSTQQETIAEKPANKLLGSWQVKEIHWHTADTTYSIPKAQPGLFLVTEKAYSIMWTPTKEPRAPFEVLAKPTDEELKAGFRSIVFNGGMYEMTDSTFTTTAQVAKVPGFEGGKQFYDYELSGNTLKLTMVDETYPDGSKPEWSGKVKTEFVLGRNE